MKVNSLINSPAGDDSTLPPSNDQVPPLPPTVRAPMLPTRSQSLLNAAAPVNRAAILASPEDQAGGARHAYRASSTPSAQSASPSASSQSQISSAFQAEHLESLLAGQVPASQQPPSGLPKQRPDIPHGFSTDSAARGLPIIRQMMLQTDRGPMVVPVEVDVQQASNRADRMRKLNAGALARSRLRRNEKIKEASQMIDRLQQQLKESNDARDFYRKKPFS